MVFQNCIGCLSTNIVFIIIANSADPDELSFFGI